jgi:N-acetylglutamate synthase-like GNAT family acetyltransferase
MTKDGISTAQIAPGAAQFERGDGRLVFRSFRESDQAATLELLQTGLLVGHVDPLDAAMELAGTEGEYLARSKDHFWVAEVNQTVIGTVAVAVDRFGVAHVRRLRVSPEWQADSRVAASLVRQAVDHACENGCLKLLFYTPVNGVRAIEFLRRLGFVFSANRKLAGVPVLEFYFDLYAAPVVETLDQTGNWSLT